MSEYNIACLDVYYYDDHARACCVLFESDGQQKRISEYIANTNHVAKYIPGQFYKRELPCLIKVLDQVKEKIDIIIIDSHVWLGQDKKGLGVYLYNEYGDKTPVIGVAKSEFKDSTQSIQVYRGKSNKPLFVSSIGIDLQWAADFVKKMKGDYRIPDVLKYVDSLTRE